MKNDLFKNRLKKIMEIRNMSPAELSRRTNIGKPIISEWLSGKYEAKQDKIFKLSKVLDCNPAWLMGYQIEMDAPLNTELAETHNDEPTVKKVTPIEFKDEVLDLLDNAVMNDTDRDMIKRTLEYICKDKEE